MFSVKPRDALLVGREQGLSGVHLPPGQNVWTQDSDIDGSLVSAPRGLQETLASGFAVPEGTPHSTGSLWLVNELTGAYEWSLGVAMRLKLTWKRPRAVGTGSSFSLPGLDSCNLGKSGDFKWKVFSQLECGQQEGRLIFFPFSFASLPSSGNFQHNFFERVKVSSEAPLGLSEETQIHIQTFASLPTTRHVFTTDGFLPVLHSSELHLCLC